MVLLCGATPTAPSSRNLQLASELELPAVTLSAPGVVETAGLLGLQPLRLQAGKQKFQEVNSAL